MEQDTGFGITLVDDEEIEDLESSDKPQDDVSESAASCTTNQYKDMTVVALEPPIALEDSLETVRITTTNTTTPWSTCFVQEPDLSSPSEPTSFYRIVLTVYNGFQGSINMGRGLVNRLINGNPADEEQDLKGATQSTLTTNYLSSPSNGATFTATPLSTQAPSLVPYHQPSIVASMPTPNLTSSKSIPPPITKDLRLQPLQQQQQQQTVAPKTALPHSLPTAPTTNALQKRNAFLTDVQTPNQQPQDRLGLPNDFRSSVKTLYPPQGNTRAVWG